MLVLKNEQTLKEQLKRWCDKARVVADNTVQGVVSEAFDKVTRLAPQYSGDFVANMRIEIGGVTPSTVEYPVNAKVPKEDAIGRHIFGLEKLYQQGASPAIQYAWRNAGSVRAQIKLGQNVFIHTTPAHPTPYAHKVESQSIPFRDVNPYASGNRLFYSVAEIMKTKYANGISSAQRTRLRNMGAL